jgi:hypothetical protein
MSKSRNLRTILLAFFATGTFVGSAIFIFDVEPGLMLSFLIASVLCLMLIVVSAFVFSLLRNLLKHWFQGRS